MNMININFGLLFIRLGLGVCLLMHGIFKLTHGIDGVKSMLVARGIPDLVAYGAYVGEVRYDLIRHTRVAGCAYGLWRV